MPRIIEFFRNRRQAGFPVIKAVLSTGKAVLLGTPEPGEDPAPDLFAKYRKAFGYLVAGLLAWAQARFGWEVPNEAMDITKDILVVVILGAFVERPRNRG